jgi:hypothetical protein
MARPPTVRQIYALAAELCERAGEEFPDSFQAASETIERLRIENGHPHDHPNRGLDARIEELLDRRYPRGGRPRRGGVRLS